MLGDGLTRRTLSRTVTILLLDMAPSWDYHVIMKRLVIYVPESMNQQMEDYKKAFGTHKTELVRQAIRHYFAYLSDADAKSKRR